MGGEFAGKIRSTLESLRTMIDKLLLMLVVDI